MPLGDSQYLDAAAAATGDESQGRVLVAVPLVHAGWISEHNTVKPGKPSL